MALFSLSCKQMEDSNWVSSSRYGNFMEGKNGTGAKALYLTSSEGHREQL